MIDSDFKLEEKLFDFLISQSGKNLPKISKDDMTELNNLFKKPIIYFNVLMNILHKKYNIMNNNQKVAILIQIKNILLNLLKEKKIQNLFEAEKIFFFMIELFCSYESDRKIKALLKMIISKLIKLNINFFNNNNSKEKFISDTINIFREKIKNILNDENCKNYIKYIHLLQIYDCLISTQKKYSNQTINYSESVNFFMHILKNIKKIDFAISNEICISIQNVIIEFDKNKHITNSSNSSIPYDFKKFIVDLLRKENESKQTIFNDELFSNENTEDLFSLNIENINSHEILFDNKESFAKINKENIEKKQENNHIDFNFIELNKSTSNFNFNDLNEFESNIPKKSPLSGSSRNNLFEDNKIVNVNTVNFDNDDVFFNQEENRNDIKIEINTNLNFEETDNYAGRNIFEIAGKNRFKTDDPIEDTEMDKYLNEDVFKLDNKENLENFDILNHLDSNTELMTFGNYDILENKRNSFNNFINNNLNNLNKEIPLVEYDVFENNNASYSRYIIILSKIRSYFRLDFIKTIVEYFKKFLKRCIAFEKKNLEFNFEKSTLVKLNFLFDDDNFESFIEITRNILYFSVFEDKNLIFHSDSNQLNENNSDLNFIFQNEKNHNSLDKFHYENLINYDIIEIYNLNNGEIFQMTFTIKSEFLQILIKLMKNVSFEQINSNFTKFYSNNKSYPINNINNFEKHFWNSSIDKISRISNSKKFLFFLKNLIEEFLKTIKFIFEKTISKSFKYEDDPYSNNIELNSYLIKIIQIFISALDLENNMINSVFITNHKEIYIFIILPLLKRKKEEFYMYSRNSDEFFTYFRENFILKSIDSVKSKVYLLSNKLAQLCSEYANFVCNINIDILLFHILKLKIKKLKNEYMFRSKNKDIEKEYPTFNALSSNDFDNILRLKIFEEIIKKICNYKENLNNSENSTFLAKFPEIQQKNELIKFLENISLNQILDSIYPGIKFFYFDEFSNFFLHLIYLENFNGQLEENNKIDNLTKNINSINKSILKNIYDIFLEEKAGLLGKCEKNIYYFYLTDILEVTFHSFSSVIKNIHENKGLFNRLNLFIKISFSDMERILDSREELVNVYFCFCLYNILICELNPGISKEEINFKNEHNDKHLDYYIEYLIKVFNRNKISNNSNSNSKNQILVCLINNIFFPEFSYDKEYNDKNKIKKEEEKNESYIKIKNQIISNSKHIQSINSGNNINEEDRYKIIENESFFDNKYLNFDYGSLYEVNNVFRHKHYNSFYFDELENNGKDNYNELIQNDENEFYEINNFKKSTINSKVKNRKNEMHGKKIFNANSDLRRFLEKIIFDKYDFLSILYNTHLKLKDPFSFSYPFEQFLYNLIVFSYDLIEKNITIIFKFFIDETLTDIEENFKSKNIEINSFNKNSNLIKGKHSTIEKYKVRISENNSFNSDLYKKYPNNFSYSNILFLEEICRKAKKHKNKKEKKSIFSGIYSVFAIAPKIVVTNYNYEDKIFNIICIYLKYCQNLFNHYNIGNFGINQIKSLINQIDNHISIFIFFLNVIKNTDFVLLKKIHLKFYFEFFKLITIFNTKMNSIYEIKKLNECVNTNMNMDDNYFNNNIKDSEMDDNYFNNNTKDSEMDVDNYYRQKSKQPIDSYSNGWISLEDTENKSNKSILIKNSSKNQNENESSQSCSDLRENRSYFLTLYQKKELESDVIFKKIFDIYFNDIKFCLLNSSKLNTNDINDPFLRIEISNSALITLIGNLSENWEKIDFERINRISMVLVELINKNNNILTKEYLNNIYLLIYLVIIKIFTLFRNSNHQINQTNNIKKQNSFKNITINLNNGNNINKVSITISEYLEKIDTLIKFGLNSEAFGYYIENLVALYYSLNLFEYYLEDIDFNIKDDLNIFHSFSENYSNEFFNYNINYGNSFNKGESVNLNQSKVFILISIYQFIIERLTILKISSNIEKTNSKNESNSEEIKIIYDRDSNLQQNYNRNLDIINNLNNKFDDLNLNLNKKRTKKIYDENEEILIGEYDNLTFDSQETIKQNKIKTNIESLTQKKKSSGALYLKKFCKDQIFNSTDSEENYSDEINVKNEMINYNLIDEVCSMKSDSDEFFEKYKIKDKEIKNTNKINSNEINSHTPIGLTLNTACRIKSKFLNLSNYFFSRNSNFLIENLTEEDFNKEKKNQMKINKQLSKFDFSDNLLLNDYIFCLYQTDCFSSFIKLQEKFWMISKKLKLNLNNIVPNYLNMLNNGIKNWEISRIEVYSDKIENSQHSKSLNEKINKNLPYFIMRPRKILKVFRRNHT